MKLYIFTLFTLLLTKFLLAQDSTISQSKFEQFKSKTGKMYRTEKGEVGQVNDILFNLYKTTDLETGDTSIAVKITQTKGFVMGPVSVGYLYIDLKEIPGVIKSIEFYKDQMQKGVPKYEPFYSYVTSNDIEVSCYYTERGMSKGWSVSISKKYHYLEGYVADSGISIRNKDIDFLIKLFKQTLELKFNEVHRD